VTQDVNPRGPDMLHGDPVLADDVWPIGRTASHFGLTRRALRFYEARGILSPMRIEARSGSRSLRFRFYDEDQRRRIALVVGARALGLPLARIAELLADDRACVDGSLNPQEARKRLALHELRRSSPDFALERLRKAAGDPPPQRSPHNSAVP
jgi:DNA-binding transcriptional MerR regulator